VIQGKEIDMRKSLILAIMGFAILSFSASTFGQGALKSGPDSSVLRDPELERDSLHNLDVARNYFKLKKAYVASLNRTQEIIAGNPNFAKIDEALFIAGMSSLALAENKGKQSPSMYATYDGTTRRQLTAEQFREMGREYLTQLVNEHPDSNFKKQAEEELRTVGGPMPKQ
jgi:outer membrane protein assembly factor BamD (BamD/ComL family)